jgi:ankyrin repeat protein
MRKKQEAIMEPNKTSPAHPIRPPRRQSEFMVACASGDLAKVERMLEDGTEPNQLNDFRETPLTWAVVWNRVDVVECLLRNGADANFPERPARSPLMYAASHGYRRIVALLIAHGADVLREDQRGMSSFQIAIDSGQYQCATLIEVAARIVGFEDIPRCPAPWSARPAARHGARAWRMRNGYWQQCR